MGIFIIEILSARGTRRTVCLFTFINKSSCTGISVRFLLWKIMFFLSLLGRHIEGFLFMLPQTLRDIDINRGLVVLWSNLLLRLLLPVTQTSEVPLLNAIIYSENNGELQISQHLFLVILKFVFIEICFRNRRGISTFTNWINRGGCSATIFITAVTLSITVHRMGDQN